MPHSSDNVITLSGKENWAAAILLTLYFALLPFSTSYIYPALIFAIYAFYIAGRLSTKRYSISPYIHYILMSSCIILPVFISLPDAVNFDESLRKTFSYFLYLIFGIGLFTTAQQKSVQDKFLLGLGMLLTFWVFDAILQYLTGTNILGYEYNKGRLTGIFYPKYRIGIVLAILAVFYFEFVRQVSVKYNMAWLLLIPYVLVIIFGANRTSWFMMCLSLMFYLAILIRSGRLRWPKMRSVLICTSLLIVACFSVFVLKPQLYENTAKYLTKRVVDVKYIMAGETQKSGAILHRIRIWESAIRISFEHPVNGVGVRGFRYMDIDVIRESERQYFTDDPVLSTHPHLIILEIVTETGLIGLMGYTLLFSFLVYGYIRMLLNREHAHSAFWLVPVMVAIFPINMHKSFYGTFSSMLIWVLLTLAFSGVYRYARNIWLPTKL